LREVFCSTLKSHAVVRNDACHGDEVRLRAPCTSVKNNELQDENCDAVRTSFLIRWGQKLPGDLARSVTSSLTTQAAGAIRVL
jgi:hypothetical protein